jgi:hypothetical protein
MRLRMAESNNGERNGSLESGIGKTWHSAGRHRGP